MSVESFIAGKNVELSRMKPKTSFLVQSLSILALLLGGSRASAQLSQPGIASVTEGVYFAPHLLGASLKPEGQEQEGGSGFGLSVGYGITRLVAVYLNLDAGNLDIRNPDPEINGRYTLGQADLGVQFNFGPPMRRAIPYLRTALTARVAFVERNDTNFELSGAALTIGGGLSYYFRPRLALDAGLDLTGGKFDKFKVEGEEVPIDEFDASGGRFHIGLTWYPFARVGDKSR